MDLATYQKKIIAVAESQIANFKLPLPWRVRGKGKKVGILCTYSTTTPTLPHRGGGSISI
jgi:hypothetical protein